MQHEAWKQPHAGAASFAPLEDYADGGLALLWEQREEGDGAEAPIEQRQELWQRLWPVDQGHLALRRGERGEEADPGLERSGPHDVRRGTASVRV